MRLSILIPTLKERAEKFKFIHGKLLKQASKKVEILSYVDNREKSIGFKRNLLLDKAKGDYVCFVDDDDDVSDTYIDNILKALKTNPDCVSMTGIITFSGNHPRTFIHSLKYKTFFDADSIYYRPPNHLNPIKTSIAKQFKFPDKSFSEDADWAMQICNADVLKTEVEINTPYYFYRFEPNK